MIDVDIGENVDRLITIELRPRVYGDDVTVKLYEAARKVVGEPLCLNAAKQLIARVKENDVVVIGTGHALPSFLPHGENDGPLGASALAGMITRGIGARVVLLCDEPVVGVLKSACMANGLQIMDKEMVKQLPRSATIIPFPVDKSEANRAAEEILAEYRPSAVISIEKIGRNKHGIYHTGRGSDMTSVIAKIDAIMLRSRELGILTIGIGDLGNEAGLGNIRQAVEKHFPYGAKCVCPCGGGVATVVESDIPIAVAVSNWGAYGIEACMFHLLGKPQLMHRAETERRMIEWSTLAGAVDGVTASPATDVDGIPMRVHACLVEMLHAIVEVKPKSVVRYRP